MPIETLKLIRFIAPPVIILAFASTLGAYLGAWEIAIPTSKDDMLFSLNVLIPGLIYYCTPIRSRINQRFFDMVSENLCEGLIRISQLPPNPKFSWKNLRGIFFSFVDSDPSLKTKAKLAYANGAAWTTLADIRAISFWFMVISVLFCYLGEIKGLFAAATCLIIIGVSYFGSLQITKRHMDIGNEQLEIIQLNHQAVLRQKMAAL